MAGYTVTMDYRDIFARILSLCFFTAATLTWAAETDTTLTPGESCQSSTCHTEIGQKKYKHPPAEDGNPCTGCHEITDPTRHVFTLPAKKGELCVNCHDLNIEGEKLHGPVAKAQCLRCHDAHASDFKKITLAKQPELCFNCHDKAVKDAEGKYLPSTKAIFEAEDFMLHKPFKRGKCKTCHKAHSSANTRLLKRAYPASFYTAYTKKKYFCLKCHKSKAFEEARTLDRTGFRNGNLNLHYRHVNREKGRTCRACHHHHGTANDKLIRKSVPFGDRFVVIEDFELTETGGTCGPTCHPIAKYDRLEPFENTFKVTDRVGVDATPEELSASQPE